MGDVFQKIIDALRQSQEHGSRIILTAGYLPLDTRHFFPLAPGPAPGIVAFVDGGNAEVLAAPHFSLQFIRIYATMYENNARARTFLREFYALVTAQKDFVYRVQTFGTDYALGTAFSAVDETLKSGIHRATPGRIGEVVRQQAEILLAEEVARTLPSGAMLVRDGDLEPSVTGLQEKYARLLSVVREKGIVLAGLAKTTRLLTDSGMSAASALRAMAPEGTWAYGAEGMTRFVKLHPRSTHVFRLDVLPQDRAGEVAGVLAANATDAAFPGYPYGLIEADTFAQVTHAEKEQLRLRILAKGGKELQQHAHGIDAHDILNLL